VATASYDKSARIWNTRTGEPVTGPLLHEEGLLSIQFSPDGNRVVTASLDKSARIWDARTGQPLTQRLRHQDGVASARFSSDGHRIVTASWDRSARVWDVTSGQPMTEALNHRDRLHYSEFSPDGQRVLTACADGTARVWEVPLASLPTPKWVPNLMEAVATKRVNEQGVFESVTAQDIAALKQEIAASSASNDWTRCGRWLFADPSARTISPFSSITVGDYVERLMDGATQLHSQEAIGRLQEAVRLAPKSGRALVNLARAMLSANPTPEGTLMADWYSRRAIKLSPEQPETWRARGEFFNHTGRLSEAFQAVEEGLIAHPRNSELWYDHGRMLAKTNRLQEAYGSFSKAIDFAQVSRTRPSPALPAFYLSRSYLLSQQGRFAEAASDFRRVKDIPPRDPSAAPGLIDLSDYYNVSLVGGNWHAGPPLDSSPDLISGYDLSELPRGVQKLAGVEYDIRGAVQVGGPTRTGEFHPVKIAGIVVGLPCRRLHFLHSAIYGGQGGMIGKYVVHYQNGQTAEIPLILGRDLSDWFIQPTKKQLQVAWIGSEPRFGGSHHLCLFKTTWENTLPDLLVSTIDFEANQQAGYGGFPFLVALTAE
jgi:tetratricopeptide (TPR) repeat protein